MIRLRRINHQYIVNHNDKEYIFAHSQQAWAFIFTIKEAENNV